MAADFQGGFANKSYWGHGSHFAHSSCFDFYVPCKRLNRFFLLLIVQKVLLAHGAAKVSAYATHGVFPNRSWEKFLYKGDYLLQDVFYFSCKHRLTFIFLVVFSDGQQGFSYFWITDSCPLTVKDVISRAPFEVLSLAGSIAAALHI